MQHHRPGNSSSLVESGGGLLPGSGEDPSSDVATAGFLHREWVAPATEARPVVGKEEQDKDPKNGGRVSWNDDMSTPPPPMVRESSKCCATGAGGGRGSRRSTSETKTRNEKRTPFATGTKMPSIRRNGSASRMELIGPVLAHKELVRSRSKDTIREGLVMPPAVYPQRGFTVADDNNDGGAHVIDLLFLRPPPPWLRLATQCRQRTEIMGEEEM